MNSINDGILDKYQVRFSKKQKANFTQYLRDSMPQHDFVVEHGGLAGNSNIVVGDVDNAKIIYTAHYDTQQVMLLPVPMIMPPNNWLWFLFWQVLVPIIIMVGPAAVMFACGLQYYVRYWLLLLFALLLLAPPNKHTVNDNTSGVMCLVELLSRGDIDTSKVAFVFFDNEEKGLFGSKYFAKKHPNVAKGTVVVNMDCIAVGDTVMVLKNKRLKTNTKLTNSIATSFGNVPEGKQVIVEDWCLYPSDQINFMRGIAVVTAKHNRVMGYYLDKVHTPLDTVLDRANIDYIADSLARLASSYTSSSDSAVVAPHQMPQ